MQKFGTPEPVHEVADTDATIHKVGGRPRPPLTDAEYASIITEGEQLPLPFGDLPEA